MVSNQSISMIESVVRASGASTKADKQRILECVQNTLGLSVEQLHKNQQSEDRIVPLSEARIQLNYKTRRSISNHLRSGALRGFYPGKQRKKCTGVLQSELDRFKQARRETQGEQCED